MPKLEVFVKDDLHPRLGVPTAYEILASGCNGNAQDLKKYAKISRLETSCLMHKNIEEYVKNSSDGVSNISVKNVFRVHRYEEKEKKKKFRIMLWHGTSPSAVMGIIQTGFRKGTSGYFGGGVYFADRIAKSIGYTRKNGNGAGYLILAEVSPGKKVYKAHHFHSDYSSPPVGYTAVKGNGARIPDWKENKDYFGAVFPSGPTVDNKRHSQYDMRYSEYILYDPDRIIVKFVVECSF